MEEPYLLDKPMGATPLQALTLLRRARGIPDTIKMAYAGRLDPLATGLLAVLHGVQLERQEDYWHLPKQYEATVVLGVRTDSFDLMGLPIRGQFGEYTPERITAVVRGMVGKIDLSVPVYSSQRYEGKPLFQWARSEQEHPIVVPVRRMVIGQIDVRGISRISSGELVDAVRTNVGTVQGDFRQEAIISAWGELFPEQDDLTAIHLDIQCASGTYIRSIAHEIGRRLGSSGVLSRLRRTRIGKWHITDPNVIGLSWPQ